MDLGMDEQAWEEEAEAPTVCRAWLCPELISSLLVIGDTYLIKRLQPPKGCFL